jgi:hypothetical protein
MSPSPVLTPFSLLSEAYSVNYNDRIVEKN